MLKIRNLTKKYLRRAALKNVSIDIEPGKTYLLLGPNGSGKTTLMKMIAGLVKSGKGDITFSGMPIGRATKARIAYMPTENYFYPYMSVKDAGKYYKDFFKDFKPRKFEKMLEQMDLDPADKIRHLSSGMAAKLRLVLTLCRNADLMMFDEPLNGVDILTRSQVISAIKANRQEKRTMIISTHLVDELEDMVDNVVFLKKGRIVLAGEYDQVCAEHSLKDLYLQIYGQISAEPDPENDYDEEEAE